MHPKSRASKHLLALQSYLQKGSEKCFIGVFDVGVAKNMDYDLCFQQFSSD